MTLNPSSRGQMTRRFLLATALGGALGGAVMMLPRAVAGAEARRVPPFRAGADGTPSEALQLAVFAGGCFWGVQGVFQHVKGVSQAISGYAGGDAAGASYAAVSSGSTGHAEAVQLSFDPRQVSYAQLLQVFFSVAHDPTQLNRQGPDHGPQYRSALFPLNDEQARTARAYIAQLDQARVFAGPIVTRIEPGRRFFAAEDHHQDYLELHPRDGYIVFHDLPKLDALKRLFPELYSATPVLVGAGRRTG